jgi:hypothetical protein
MLVVVIDVTLGISPEGKRILIQAVWKYGPEENIWMKQKGTKILSFVMKTIFWK